MVLTLAQNTTPSLHEKMDVEAGLIVVPLYRKHLEDALVELAPSSFGSTIDFLSLFKNYDFCYAFAMHILDPQFINNQLIAIYAGGTRDYAESIAYLYERMRRTLCNSASSSAVSQPQQGQDQVLADVGSKSAADHWRPYAEKHEAFHGDAEAIQKFLDTSLPLEWSDNELLQPPTFTSVGKSFNTQYMTDSYLGNMAFDLSNKVTTGSEPGPDEGPWKTYYDDTYYGADLVNWVNSQFDNGYSDVFNWGNVQYTQSQQKTGFECFIPGTLVRTRDGDVPIQDLKGGDQVLSKLPSTYGE
jgi:hypothetical protein